MTYKNSRRHFMKSTLGALGGTLAAGMAGLFPEVQPVLAQAARGTTPLVQPPTQLEIGELFAGFLLLAEEVPAPYFVRYPKPGPYACGVGMETNPHLATSGETKQFEDLRDLIREVEFPVYTFRRLPEGLRMSHAFVTRYDETHAVYNVMIGFETYNPEIDYWETTVLLEIIPDFPRPFPLWYREAESADDIATTLEKVDFLPSPGIRVSTQAGYVHYWIWKNVFYTLTIEPSPNDQYARELVDSLATA